MGRVRLSRGGGGNVRNVYDSMLLAQRGGWWVSNFQEKNVTQHFNDPYDVNFDFVSSDSGLLYFVDK